MTAAKIIVEPMERSLPTSVAYRSERITSFRKELDILEDGPTPLDKIAAIRRDQLADLDAQEALLRAKYDMLVPNPSALQLPGGDFTTADQVAAAIGLTPEQRAAGVARATALQVPAYAAPQAERGRPVRVTPPPSAMRDVLDGTVDELRRVVGQLHAEGDDPEITPPATEEDAQALLASLRSRLFDRRQKKAPVVPTKPPAPTGFHGGQSAAAPIAKPVAADNAVAWPAAATVKPADRTCKDKSHSARNPRFITTREWDAGIAAHGEPLCDPHLMDRRMNAKRSN